MQDSFPDFIKKLNFHDKNPTADSEKNVGEIGQEITLNDNTATVKKHLYLI